MEQFLCIQDFQSSIDRLDQLLAEKESLRDLPALPMEKLFEATITSKREKQQYSSLTGKPCVMMGCHIRNASE